MGTDSPKLGTPDDKHMDETHDAYRSTHDSADETISHLSLRSVAFASLRSAM